MSHVTYIHLHMLTHFTLLFILHISSIINVNMKRINVITSSGGDTAVGTNSKVAVALGQIQEFASLIPSMKSSTS